MVSKKKINPVAADGPTNQLAHMGFQRAPNDRVWDWLRDAHENVSNYLMAPAAILPFVTNPELNEKVIAGGDGKRLAECVRSITNDSRSFKDALVALYGLHSARRGSSSNADDLFYAISLSQQYLAIIEEYQRVVLPVIEEVIEIFEKVGLELPGAKTIIKEGIDFNIFHSAKASESVH